ncbi:unnamed protein product [Enterobius vermicularis]|uniref:Aldo_ket_red domain-containing protein n=1 Tax=Enterobius vermicularis TaxID=51028 RepID=A0A0N4V3A1_ENTVE|nr:unnamed protein product [Enterobius vermicularis]
MVVRGPTLKLPTGAEMPAVGLGTWLSKPNEVGNAVKYALDCGYRLIDTAEFYGNEKEIGDTLQAYFKAGKLKREDVFITTKVNIRFFRHTLLSCFCNHFKPEQMDAAIQGSLDKLQFDYVDLYLAHSPAALNVALLDTHFVFCSLTPAGFLELKRNFLGRQVDTRASCHNRTNLAVSNFTVAQMERVLKISTVPIHNLQVFDFEISSSEMEQLNGLKKNYRTAGWDFLKGHSEDPFKSER